MIAQWIPAKGNLVSWVNGPPKNTGVITEAGVHMIKVQFDFGENIPFAWPNDVLSRQVFKPGDKVQLRPKNEIGIVLGVIRTEPIAIYEIGTPNGNPKVEESGLRPLVIKDPAQLLRQREIHEAKSTNLRIVARRLLFDYQFNDFSSLSNSRVEIKPHQVGVLHRVATSYPYRFLLADEVGLGKTIEAGMIIKELKARGLASRVLIVAPSGLVGQWQMEMRSKFGMVFSRFNRETVSYLEGKHLGENVWTLEDNIVTSASFASMDEERRKAISLVPWDLVVFDEAHHARRTLDSETILKWSETQIYKLAESLASLYVTS
jgi:SNF2 family DNA or RNA helicase